MLRTDCSLKQEGAPISIHRLHLCIFSNWHWRTVHLLFRLSSMTTHNVTSTTVLHLSAVRELHIAAHCTARLSKIALALGYVAWKSHITTFTSTFGCAHLSASLWTSPLQAIAAFKGSQQHRVGCWWGSVPGLAAGGPRALPQRLHGDILESFRQLAVRGRRLTACHEALPVQLHACATPIHPTDS